MELTERELLLVLNGMNTDEVFYSKVKKLYIENELYYMAKNGTTNPSTLEDFLRYHGTCYNEITSLIEREVA